MGEKMKTSWVAVGFASIAAITQPFAPLWLFMTLILASVITTGVGLYLNQRRWRKELLIAQMDAAFGIPKDRK